jgi:hypothetical protein
MYIDVLMSTLTLQMPSCNFFYLLVNVRIGPISTESQSVVVSRVSHVALRLSFCATLHFPPLKQLAERKELSAMSVGRLQRTISTIHPWNINSKAPVCFNMIRRKFWRHIHKPSKRSVNHCASRRDMATFFAFLWILSTWPTAAEFNGEFLDRTNIFLQNNIVRQGVSIE